MHLSSQWKQYLVYIPSFHNSGCTFHCSFTLTSHVRSCANLWRSLTSGEWRSITSGEWRNLTSSDWRLLCYGRALRIVLLTPNTLHWVGFDLLREDRCIQRYHTWDQILRYRNSFSHHQPDRWYWRMSRCWWWSEGKGEQRNIFTCIESFYVSMELHGRQMLKYCISMTTSLTIYTPT